MRSASPSEQTPRASSSTVASSKRIQFSVSPAARITSSEMRRTAIFRFGVFAIDHVSPVAVFSRVAIDRRASGDCKRANVFISSSCRAAPLSASTPPTDRVPLLSHRQPLGLHQRFAPSRRAILQSIVAPGPSWRVPWPFYIQAARHARGTTRLGLASPHPRVARLWHRLGATLSRSRLPCYPVERPSV